MPNVVFTDLVFVDTNALHKARLYLVKAKEMDWAPFGSVDVPSRNQLQKTFGAGLGQGLKDGGGVYAYLKRKVALKNSLCYAPISALEECCGILRAKASLRCLGQLSPDRCYDRLTDSEVDDWLQADDRNEAVTTMSKLIAVFDEAGISIDEHPCGEGFEMAVAYGLANVLLENAYLDTGDCLIYITALLAQAIEIVTLDGHFKDTCLHIRDPKQARESEVERFVAARSALEREYANLTGTLISSDKVRMVFPSAISPKSIGQSGNGH